MTLPIFYRRCDIIAIVHGSLVTLARKLPWDIFDLEGKKGERKKNLPHKYIGQSGSPKSTSQRHKGKGGKHKMQASKQPFQLPATPAEVSLFIFPLGV